VQDPREEKGWPRERIPTILGSRSMDLYLDTVYGVKRVYLSILGSRSVDPWIFIWILVDPDTQSIGPSGIHFMDPWIHRGSSISIFEDPYETHQN
jgi:hypothetical protein